MRHSRRTLLSSLERFFRFQNIGALQVAHFGREFIQTAAYQRQRHHVFGMAIALNDLR